MTDSLSYRKELVDPSVYIAPGAVVLGDVTIGANSSIWFQAVLRGDTASIEIGQRTNVQDGCILHADPGYPCVIGSDVSLGHGAIVHGATVEDEVLIGMRAVVMNGAKIGRGSLLAVGTVVLEGMTVPPGSVVMGMPGKVKRQVTPEDLERIRHAALHYVDNGQRYLSAGEAEQG